MQAYGPGQMQSGTMTHILDVLACLFAYLPCSDQGIPDHVSLSKNLSVIKCIYI